MKKLAYIFILFLVIVLPYSVFSQEYTGIKIGAVKNNSFFDFNEKTNKIEITAPDLKSAEKTGDYYFVYKKAVGDFTFSTNIKPNDSDFSQNRIGIMIRNTTDQNSVFGEIGIKDSTISRMFRRGVTIGYGTAMKNCLCNDETDFLSLERKKDTVYYKISSKGDELKLYGTDILDLQDTVVVGVFFKPVAKEQLNKADFYNVKLEKQ